MDDWEFDDWSETGEWDSTDEWDAADDPQVAWADDLDDGDDGDVAGWDDPGASVDHRDLGEEQEPMVSAWDAGTAAAIAGWLLDRQAEQIVEGVRAAVTRAPAQAPAGYGRTSSHLPSGPPIDWEASPLHLGDRLDRSRLAVTIAVRLGANRPLGLDAGPVVAAGPVPSHPGLDWSALSFSVAVTRIVPDLPVWVMFDDRQGGFRAADLRDALDDEGPAGRAYRFVAAPSEAVDAVERALERYGLRLPDFRWAGGF